MKKQSIFINPADVSKSYYMQVSQKAQEAIKEKSIVRLAPTQKVDHWAKVSLDAKTNVLIKDISHFSGMLTYKVLSKTGKELQSESRVSYSTVSDTVCFGSVELQKDLFTKTLLTLQDETNEKDAQSPSSWADTEATVS